MSPKKHDPKELYDLVQQAGGKQSIYEIAKSAGVRAHMLTFYVMQYAAANGLEVPSMVFTEPKPPEMVKGLQRGAADNFLRVSALQLQKSGLGETLQFKLVGDPTRHVVVLVDRSNPATSFTDLVGGMLTLEELEQLVAAKKAVPVVAELPAARPVRGQIRPLRVPKVPNGEKKNATNQK